MRTVLKYPGAKNRIAKWICEYIPPHGVYLEPFFGSGAVFFNKEPAKIETINDLDDDVVNYFEVIRDKSDELIAALEMTPYAREEYNRAFVKSEKDSDVERVRKFVIKCWMGFGCSNLYKNGFRSSQQSTSPRTTKEWNEFPERLRAAAMRLKMAQIEKLPAVELIRRYNSADVFIYADPPYLRDLRKSYLYRHEMTDGEHMELLQALKEHPGKVMISGYESDLYNQELSGWKKIHKTTQAEAGIKRVETIWMNYNQPGQLNFKI